MNDCRCLLGMSMPLNQTDAIWNSEVEENQKRQNTSVSYPNSLKPTFDSYFAIRVALSFR